MADIVTDHLEWDIRIHQALDTTVPEGVGSGPVNLNTGGAEIMGGAV